MAKEIILDIQGFKIPNNNFVLKELATITLEEHDENIHCVIFEPPCDWGCLPENYKRTNAWLSRNFHGISWTQGSYPYKSVKDILNIILKNHQYIYVKGLGKKEWLQQFIGSEKTIIDMEKFGCPSLRILEKIANEYLSQHNNTHDIIVNNSNRQCALEHVVQLKKWFMSHHSINEPSLERSLQLYYYLGGNMSEMQDDDIAHFPKEFILLEESENLDKLWNKLPKCLKEDDDIRKCYEIKKI